jgi:hypothetical protein
MTDGFDVFDELHTSRVFILSLSSDYRADHRTQHEVTRGKSGVGATQGAGMSLVKVGDEQNTRLKQVHHTPGT